MRIPAKGDVISFRGSYGTSKNTKFVVLTNLDRQGFATIKSIKSNLRKKVLLNPNMMFGKMIPNQLLKETISFHDNLKQ